MAISYAYTAKNAVPLRQLMCQQHTHVRKQDGRYRYCRRLNRLAYNAERRRGRELASQLNTNSTYPVFETWNLYSPVGFIKNTWTFRSVLSDVKGSNANPVSFGLHVLKKKKKKRVLAFAANRPHLIASGQNMREPNKRSNFSYADELNVNSENTLTCRTFSYFCHIPTSNFAAFLWDLTWQTGRHPRWGVERKTMHCS